VGKGQKPEHSGPASQGLGDPLQEEQVLGAGQEVLAPFLALVVNALFEVWQQIRGILNLVEDDRGRMQLEKGPGVRRRRQTEVRKFQRDIAMRRGEQVLEQRGLA